MTVLSFTVHGTPVPKGSAKAFVHPTIPNRAIVTHANTKTKAWGKTVAAAASEAYDGQPWEGPVRVDIYCFFARPKSHYRTGKFAGEIKPGAPRAKTTKPDADKLSRGILDGLTGILYVDDSQVIDVSVSKMFANYDQSDRAIVSVEFIGE